MGPFGRSRAAFYSRSDPSLRGGAACNTRGVATISATVVDATSTQNVLTPLLVAHPSNSRPLRGRNRRGVKDRLIPPEGVQDAT